MLNVIYSRTFKVVIYTLKEIQTVFRHYICNYLFIYYIKIVHEIQEKFKSIKAF